MDLEQRAPRRKYRIDEWRAAYDHGGVWTEDDFEAIPVDIKWVELHDGSLILRPTGTPPHQYAIRHLWGAVCETVDDDRVIGSLDLRMAEGRRFRVPDLIVTRDPIVERPVEAADALLVCEVVDVEGGDERGNRMIAYAEAGIPQYLIIEPAADGRRYAATLHHLRDGAYVPVAEVEPGGVLTIEEPFHAVIDLRELEY